MTVECPECGSVRFRVEREDGDRFEGALFWLSCDDCGNSTAQVAARLLDRRLQRDDDQAGLAGWSE